ncbi:MAG: dolichol kinase [Hadesarchaea archaeon]|nr:dolichol kinase [Hadesarchaea archaeon]
MFHIPALEEIAISFMLVGWVVFVILFLTKKTYEVFIARGCTHHVAVYYNRKIIHMLTGGLVAILVPLLYKSFIPIGVMVLLLAIGNYLPHRQNKLFYWYQVEENIYEVHFIIMWGLIMMIGFLINNVWIAVVPILFMSFGDGVTGIVRNMLYRKRTKSWWGNLAMFAVCAPMAYFVFNLAGLVSAALASIVEKFEFGLIDDNITVPLVGFVSLLLLTGPLKIM